MAYVFAYIFWRVLRKWEIVSALLVLVGTMGLGGSQVGQWLHYGIDIAQTALVAQIGKYTGATVTGIVGLVASAYFLVHVIKDRTAHKSTLVAAVVAPMTAATIPGALGTAIGGLFGLAGTLVASLIGMALGMH
jgi:hypothetical protein